MTLGRSSKYLIQFGPQENLIQKSVIATYIVIDFVYIPTTQTLRSWSASNVVWTHDHILLKQVAFKPMMPHDINSEEVVCMEMNNIKSLCFQVVQSHIPLYADEKVYSIATLTQLWRPVQVHRPVFRDVAHCEKPAEVLWQEH